MDVKIVTPENSPVIALQIDVSHIEAINLLAGLLHVAEHRGQTRVMRELRERLWMYLSPNGDLAP